VFREVAGQALLTPVEVGQRMEASAQVLSGLEAGERVVAFPGSRLADGVRVVERGLD